MAIEDQVENLRHCVQGFTECMESLHRGMFLKKNNGWSPRDILAHLIGWNRYTVKGCEQIQRGDLPFYFDDPGEDYCKVNAVSVREYSSEDIRELLDELEVSTNELIVFLGRVDPVDWDRDYGVRYQGFNVTIQNSVDALIEDYIKHRQQLEEWV